MAGGADRLPFAGICDSGRRACRGQFGLSMDAAQLKTCELGSDACHERGYRMNLLSTLADLVAINSINPAYENGRPEEGVAQYVEEFFRNRNIETFRQPVLP